MSDHDHRATIRRRPWLDRTQPVHNWFLVTIVALALADLAPWEPVRGLLVLVAIVLIARAFLIATGLVVARFRSRGDDR